MSDAPQPPIELTLPAADVAAALGIAEPELREAMRRGVVYQVTEIGSGPDAGTARVTFRYRAREARLIIDLATARAIAPKPAAAARP
ncbi:MAG: hypothetical protein JNK11_11275 [Alphaproteobacteria bacterium]|nr:hypothetical protein [Alphaproteobacteria bacterium]